MGAELSAELADAEGGAGETWASHGTWHGRAGGKGGLQRAARARATAQIGMGDTTRTGAGERARWHTE